MGRGPCDIAVAGVPCAVLCAAVSLAGGALLFACAPPPPPRDVRPLLPSVEAPDDVDADADPGEARPAAASTGAPLVWLSSEREARERGLDQGRPVLVHFDSQWCADCKRMNAETLGDPRVKARAGRFVAVRIDATNDEDPQVSAALQKYTVINVPTLILLDSSGHEQRRFTELVGPETLLHEIDQVR